MSQETHSYQLNSISSKLWSFPTKNIRIFQKEKTTNLHAMINAFYNFAKGPFTQSVHDFI